MSGDVQPRKRKDKRRKKGQLEAKRSEEYMEESAVFRRQSSTASSPDEEELHHAGSTGPEEIIHIQKDLGLGGNICAKIVFFCLLGALGVMVGLIITEYRGSNEVETQSTLDSPWSLWLDGWIDDAPSHHEAEVDTGEIEDDHENSEEGIDSKEEHSQEEEEESDDDSGEDGSQEEEEEEEDDDDTDGGVSESQEDEEEDEEEEEEEEGNVSKEGDDDDDDSQENNESEEDGENEKDISEEESEENQSKEKYKFNLDESEEDVSNESEEDGERQIENEDDESREKEESEEKDDSGENNGSDEKDESGENNGSDEKDESGEEVEREEEESGEMRTGDSGESLNEVKIKFRTKSHRFYKKNKDDESNEQEVEDEDEGVKLNIPGSDDEDSSGEKHSTTSSEEEKEDLAKISEILRRTSKKVKIGLIEDEDEEEVKEVKKPKEVIKEEKEEEEESPVDKEEEESPVDKEEEDETAGGEESVGQHEDNETEVEGEIIPEIARRQTLIPPPEELQTSAPPAQEEYSEDDEEDEEEEEEDEEELVQKTYEDLRAKYQQQITPEGSDIEPTEEDFATKAPENYDYSPTPPESDPEEGPTESDVEEDEEEEEEDRDPMAEWKRRGPALLAEEVEDVQTGSESEDEPPPPPVAPTRRGGPRGSGEQDYENADITNDADWEIREDLDFADADINDGKPDVALSKFTALLARYPHSPRVYYGKAKALDRLAEAQRSNQLLVSAIETYTATLELPNVPDGLFQRVANRTIDRMRFRGLHLQAVGVHNKLIARYHNDSSHRIELAITYMMINRLDDAKLILKSSLDRWPEEGLIQAYYGLVLKLRGEHEESIPYLQRGLESQAPGTNNSHFYFHLGDTLARKGQVDKAMQLYEKGASQGLFRSKYQRSLYNVDHLRAQPWWSIEETTYTQFFRKLENNWKVIRDEGLAALKSQKGFMDEAESLRDTGSWKQFEIFARGQKHRTNCEQTPVTCRLIDEFKPASSCKRGQSKFSVMEGRTHVWAHCGPTNCRLRAHLGLVIPHGTAIRVANTARNWSEGKVIIFDDSFEHEVWHNGTENRLVLIVDVWHPELTAQERSTLTAI